MSKFIYIFIIICFFAFFVAATAEESGKVKARQPGMLSGDLLMNNSSQGKDFWIAIPPNEAQSQSVRIALEIYVSSKVNTTITLEVPETGQLIKKDIKAFQVTTFSSRDGETDFNWEIRDPEKALDKGIHLYSPDLVTVYVFNSRSYTSEGYLAIPVSSWGRRYMHLSYYDFFEQYTNMGAARGGGFVIVASEDNTNCRIILRGKGKNISETNGGKKIGDTVSVTLNKGQTYLIMGNGKTSGKFDLSGSEVVSDKFIGFISFHMRTKIPSDLEGDGRNYLVEMMPPVNAWGRLYSTVEYKRENRGDFFRLIASEDSTRWSVKYFDKNTGIKTGEYSGLLAQSGDVEDFGNAPDGRASIKGASVWQADKPVLVMQYSYSADWDNSPEFDPFMILVVPTEQYVRQTIFQTPNKGQFPFQKNLFNIIAVGDPADSSHTLIKSLMLDSQYIYKLYPGFVDNRIPGTGLYWLHIDLKPGAHIIEGSALFGGYIYGFDRYNSYGWPGAIGFNNIVSVKDSLAPELAMNQYCGDYILTITELRNGDPHDDPRQEDKGIKSVRMLPGSYNYDFKQDSTTSQNDGQPERVINCRANVADKSMPAMAIIEATDNAGNFRLDTLLYSPGMLPIVRFSLRDVSPDSSLLPGKTVNAELEAACTKWSEAALDQFEYSISYPKGSVKYNNDLVKGSAMDDSWTLTATETPLDDSLLCLKITGKGVNAIKEDLALCSLSFSTFLQPDNELLPRTLSLKTNNDICLRTESDFNIIGFNTCAYGLRQVIFSGIDYSLKEISPNPAISGMISVNYSIGLDAETRLEVVNSFGETVVSRVDHLKAGHYETSIDSGILMPGVYYLRLSSGPFRQAREFVVVR